MPNDIAQGDFAAFEQLYQRHKGWFVSLFFLRPLGDSLCHWLKTYFRNILEQGHQQAPRDTKFKLIPRGSIPCPNKLHDSIRHIKVVDRVMNPRIGS